ncbi:MAG: hypothetical protein WA790_11410 [Sulfitobacter sp.]
MTICFMLPDGQHETCWVTRNKWLFLILRLSKPEDLPQQILGKYDISKQSGRDEASHASSEDPRNTGLRDVASDKGSSFGEVGEGLDNSNIPVLVEKIGVFKVDDTVRVSFSLTDRQSAGPVKVGSRRVNLTLSEKECASFEEMLRSRAVQAGWDLEAGLKRLSAHVQRQQGKSRSKVH